MENNKQIMTVETLSKEKLIEFLNIAGVASKLTEKERLNFVEIAQAYQLNPFKREIYCNSYGEGQNRQTSIITGYEVYIKRAERTGKLNGWEVKIEGKMPDLKAIITIYRKDWEKPFTHEVYFEEVCQKKRDGHLNSIWAKMPRFMTKKVAIAQGFRLCFSDELGGMPYTADELPQEEKIITAQVVEEKPQINIETIIQELAKCQNKEEVRKISRKYFDKYPQMKQQIFKAYNDRLAELLQSEVKENV